MTHIYLFWRKKTYNWFCLFTQACIDFLTENRVTTLFQQWFSVTFPWPKKWISVTLAVFHDFPGLENGLTKFHDFPGRVVTLRKHCINFKIFCSLSFQTLQNTQVVSWNIWVYIPLEVAIQGILCTITIRNVASPYRNMAHKSKNWLTCTNPI